MRDWKGCRKRTYPLWLSLCLIRSLLYNVSSPIATADTPADKIVIITSGRVRMYWNLHHIWQLIPLSGTLLIIVNKFICSYMHIWLIQLSVHLHDSRHPDRYCVDVGIYPLSRHYRQKPFDRRWWSSHSAMFRVQITGRCACDKLKVLIWRIMSLKSNSPWARYPGPDQLFLVDSLRAICASFNVVMFWCNWSDFQMVLGTLPNAWLQVSWLI